MGREVLKESFTIWILLNNCNPARGYRMIFFFNEGGFQPEAGAGSGHQLPSAKGVAMRSIQKYLQGGVERQSLASTAGPAPNTCLLYKYDDTDE